MNQPTMKRTIQFLASAVFLLFLVSQLLGQEQHTNYGKTPDDWIPYGHFQKAYKNFFDDTHIPDPFLGKSCHEIFQHIFGVTAELIFPV